MTQFFPFQNLRWVRPGRPEIMKYFLVLLIYPLTLALRDWLIGKRPMGLTKCNEPLAIHVFPYCRAVRATSTDLLFFLVKIKQTYQGLSRLGRLEMFAVFSWIFFNLNVFCLGTCCPAWSIRKKLRVQIPAISKYHMFRQRGFTHREY